MITFLGLLSVALFIALIITLFIGLIKPALVLRWTKKPTRLKVFGYWVLSMIIIIPTIGLLVSLTESEKTKPSTIIVEETLNYGIITQEKGLKVIINAYYDAEIYKSENIAKVLRLIAKTAKEENPNKKIDIRLHPSERKGKTNRMQQIAQYSSYNDPKISYYDELINALNTRKTNKDYLELEQFLYERNTSVYEVHTKMLKIAQNSLTEADKKFGKYNYPMERLDFEEKMELEGIAKLFKEYNIPDSLNFKIDYYSIYCK